MTWPCFVSALSPAPLASQTPPWARSAASSLAFSCSCLRAFVSAVPSAWTTLSLGIREALLLQVSMQMSSAPQGLQNHPVLVCNSTPLLSSLCLFSAVLSLSFLITFCHTVYFTHFFVYCLSLPSRRKRLHEGETVSFLSCCIARVSMGAKHLEVHRRIWGPKDEDSHAAQAQCSGPSQQFPWLLSWVYVLYLSVYLGFPGLDLECIPRPRISESFSIIYRWYCVQGPTDPGRPPDSQPGPSPPSPSPFWSRHIGRTPS